MRVGVTLYAQNFQDWDRYEAVERGEDAPPLDASTDHRVVQNEIEMGLAAEELGFDSLWTVEHHIGPYTLVPNPLQFLTFFAGATKRIDVGTMVVVLPWHHPLRVAEDIATLQYALRGRKAFIGFGRGAARREFKQLGFDMNESKDRFHEAVQVVKLALANEKFSFQGEHYKFEDVTLRPRPLDPEELLDNLHFSWGSRTSAPIGASHGLRPMIIPQKPLPEYHVDLENFGRARAEIGLPPSRPRIHLIAYCAETEEEARRGAERFFPEYGESAIRNYEIGGSHFAHTKGYEQYADQAKAVKSREQLIRDTGQVYVDYHLWGTPEQCIAKLRALSDAFHPEEFMLAFRVGEMPYDEARKSMELFAREVLPAVHAIELEEPIAYEAASV